MKQYNRQAEIIIGNRSFHSDKFDFEFEVEFDDTPNLNHASVTLYNLSHNTIRSIQKDMPIIINAGYEGDVGGIFVGSIYNSHSVRRGVDRETTIKAVDAAEQRGKLRVNRSYKSGTRASQIIADLCSLTGVSIGALSLPEDVQYRSGKNLNGYIITLLKEIANDCGAKFNINKGLAYFTGPNEGQDVQFLFNRDRGLIGSPEPFVEEDEGGNEIRGYNVEALLNHRLNADAIITIESMTANGKYRVRKGTHIYSLDQMVTEMEVVEQ